MVCVLGIKHQVTNLLSTVFGCFLVCVLGVKHQVSYLVCVNDTLRSGYVHLSVVFKKHEALYLGKLGHGVHVEKYDEFVYVMAVSCLSQKMLPWGRHAE